MSFVVMISSAPVSGSDYGHVNDNRVGFVSCQKEKCIDVTIVDDTVSEEKEQFNIHLRRTPDHGRSIELDQSAVDGVVEITDNDSRYVNHASYCSVLKLDINGSRSLTRNYIKHDHPCPTKSDITGTLCVFPAIIYILKEHNLLFTTAQVIIIM